MEKAYIIDVRMGYGHQRTAYSLKDLGIKISANFYQGIPEKDKKLWENSQKFYETISRVKRVPLMGNFIFSLYDNFQKILSYYPKRDLSKPTLNLSLTYFLIKKGWGRDFIEKLKKKPLPFVSTFYIPAFMAEFFKYPNEILIVVCDADIGRHWAPLKPKESRIKYLCPCSWTKERLKTYGIKPENIILTGYPLPKELVGKDSEIAKENLRERILNLDPERKFYQRYRSLIKEYLHFLPLKVSRPLTILFSVGGAGAQKEIPIRAIKSLKEEIKEKNLKFILSAGIREEIKNYFFEKIKALGLLKFLNTQIEIIYEKKIEDYFSSFNRKLKETDILWTKPSELSFFAGLGIPILIAPSIGSQEDFNKSWLLHINAGILQKNPRYINEWLFDLLRGGTLAEMAINGFIEIEKRGTYQIEKVVDFFLK